MFDRSKVNLTLNNLPKESAMKDPRDNLIVMKLNCSIPTGPNYRSVLAFLMMPKLLTSINETEASSKEGITRQ